EGLHVENGHLSPYLIRDRMKMETVLENPYVLMTTQPISSVQELMGAIGQVMRRPEPLIILAEKVDGAALGMLVQNNQRGTLEATAIRAPGSGTAASPISRTSPRSAAVRSSRPRPGSRWRTSPWSRSVARGGSSCARTTRRSSRARAPRSRSRAA
ncbi:MAG TPA: hypothetical protein VGF63_01030, partial [Solirubrobacteraceae bacterium]